MGREEEDMAGGGGAVRRWQLEVAAGWVEELGTETEMEMTFWKVVK